MLEQKQNRFVLFLCVRLITETFGRDEYVAWWYWLKDKVKSEVSLTCGFMVSIWIESVCYYGEVRSRGSLTAFAYEICSKVRRNWRERRRTRQSIRRIVKRHLFFFFLKSNLFFREKLSHLALSFLFIIKFYRLCSYVMTEIFEEEQKKRRD